MTSVPAVAVPDPVRLATDVDGNRIGVIEPGRVVLVGVPSLMAMSELGIAGDLTDNDVHFVSDLGRLAVMSRSAGRAVLHIVDPDGPTKVGEVQFRNSARIVAVAGSYVLTVAGNVTAVVDVTQKELAAIPLPTRGGVTQAASLGPAMVVLAIGGALEQWNLEQRTPGRRLRLDRPIDPFVLGGNSDRIWVVQRDTRHIVDIVTMASRTTKQLELPEPAHAIEAHPDGNLIAMIGADSRRGYVVDLVRSIPTTLLDGGELTALAWAQHGDSIVVKPEAGPLTLLSTRPEPEARTDEAEDVPPEAEPSSLAEPEEPDEAARPPAANWSRDEISRRLAQWRSRYQTEDAAAPNQAAADTESITTPALTSLPAATPAPFPSGGWRGQLADWSRAILARQLRPLPEELDRTALELVAVRTNLPPALLPAIALLYGAYLLGHRDVAPIDLAAVTDYAWPEALAQGQLARAGITATRRGRTRLVAEARAVLDDAPALARTDRPERVELEARLRGS